MNYVLLGNGFDIHHQLPTRYIDVLNFLGFWMGNENREYSSVKYLVESYLENSPDENYDK